jgi:ER-bound oxygenase mpaB/B'/Rubber oxygenase, catalytic domain
MMNLLAESDYSQVVSADNLERELNQVRATAAGPLSGVFGPRSVTWQIDRESAIFLGAGRALLLQLAHPWVAAAIQQHSHAFADPVGRFHRTFSTVFSMVFGTLDQSMSAARRLYRRHAAPGLPDHFLSVHLIARMRSRLCAGSDFPMGPLNSAISMGLSHYFGGSTRSSQGGCGMSALIRRRNNGLQED